MTAGRLSLIFLMALGILLIGGGSVLTIDFLMDRIPPDEVARVTANTMRTINMIRAVMFGAGILLIVLSAVLHFRAGTIYRWIERMLRLDVSIFPAQSRRLATLDLFLVSAVAFHLGSYFFLRRFRAG